VREGIQKGLDGFLLWRCVECLVVRFPIWKSEPQDIAPRALGGGAILSLNGEDSVFHRLRLAPYPGAEDVSVACGFQQRHVFGAHKPRVSDNDQILGAEPSDKVVDDVDHRATFVLATVED